MTGRILSPLSGLLVAVSGLSAQAQDSIKPLPLEPIEVTAVREGAIAPPAVTLTVEAEQIRRSQATNPYDLVRRLAGIEVHEHGQGPGFAADAVLRGFTSDHSSDVLLVVDGVPINLPVHGHVEGYADWYMLAAPALREIRVIHGPASPLYGNFAFGGVVEAHTDVDDTGTSARLGSSSDADVTGWFREGRRGEDGGHLLVAEGERTRGWREHAGYWLGNAVLRGWRRVGLGRLEGGVSLYGSSWDSPGFLTVDQFNAGDLRRAVDPTDGGDAHRAIAHARYTGAIGSGGIQATVWGQELRSLVFLNLPEDGVLEQSEERDARLAVGGRAQALWSIAGSELTLGTELRRDASEYRLYATEARERLSATTALDGDYTGFGLYARWRPRVGDRVTLDLGARLDGLHYASADSLAGGGEAGPIRASSSEWLASPKLGARTFLGLGVTAFGSLSRGFRGAPGVLADPDRPAMTTWAKELGLELRTGRFLGRLAAFRLDVSNERIQDPVSREISDAGASVRQGVSFDGAWELARRWTLSGSFTFNDAYISEEVRFDGLDGALGPSGSLSLDAAGPGSADPIPRPRFHVEPLAPGDPVPNVARYTGRVSLETRLDEATDLRATWRFSGPFSPIGEADLRTQEYGVLDLGAVVPLPLARTSLDLELENLFNATYPEVRSSGFINPGTRRSLRAAIRFGGGARTVTH